MADTAGTPFHNEPHCFHAPDLHSAVSDDYVFVAEGTCHSTVLVPLWESLRSLRREKKLWTVAHAGNDSNRKGVPVKAACFTAVLACGYSRWKAVLSTVEATNVTAVQKKTAKCILFRCPHHWTNSGQGLGLNQAPGANTSGEAPWAAVYSYHKKKNTLRMPHYPTGEAPEPTKCCGALKMHSSPVSMPSSLLEPAHASNHSWFSQFLYIFAAKHSNQQIKLCKL